MVVHFNELDKQAFREMTFRESVKEIPVRLKRADRLTKTQVATLFMIQNGSTRDYRQIRNYDSSTSHSGVYKPSENVPLGLEKKGWVRVKKKKQVSRRTGRGPSGYEKKKEGGGIRVQAKDELDTIAKQLGYKSRHSQALDEFMTSIMKQHPQAD